MSALLHNVLTSRLAAASLDQQEASESGGKEGQERADAEVQQHLQQRLRVDSLASPSDDEDELVGVSTAPGTSTPTPFNLSRPSSPPPADQAATTAPSPPLPSSLSPQLGSSGTGSASAASSSASSPLLLPTTSPRKRSGLSSAAGVSVGTSKSNSIPGSTRGQKSKLDPLRAFPSELSQRIFLSLPTSALLSCSLVCKRWRRSATLNYCWYKQYQSTFGGLSDSNAFDPSVSGPSITSVTSLAGPVGTCERMAENGIVLPPLGSGEAKWTRRESRTDWKNMYGKARRQEAKDAARAALANSNGGGSLPFLGGTSASRSGSGTSTPSRSQRLADAGIRTARDVREQQWAELKAAEAAPRISKSEMREHYKGLGSKGGKVKGKTGKGGVKTGTAGDGGLWD
ncbi:hypothetical protein K437DRAFT_258124 [Tilletiaria anomala UBC 951]|uniref:F-box domain-containing protein n=1 Tax=Tilletiaria anomala (strain ATCC 24038 / CBS 436.72 / UBC 951) TaxID=1037660 RepID=A0A066VT72_TILAU|nr:uncharacterized protein K437DRAFT_258124 [Tilletiaria anomala UBC 951]KDN41775.1 hypothetical protein K437DRAFT_258124 [Tilletiaria anomala UBC 951]